MALEAIISEVLHHTLNSFLKPKNLVFSKEYKHTELKTTSTSQESKVDGARKAKRGEKLRGQRGQ